MVSGPARAQIGNHADDSDRIGFSMRQERPDLEQRTALLAAARAAAASARAKHSGFRVGAAVLDEAGRVHPGCNVESDSYGLTICAERVAVFAALAAGARSLAALAVSCPDAETRGRGDAVSDTSLMPCGACRQIMAEYLASGATILVDRVGTFSPGELLPEAFRLPE
jgi:cytidine deaminase